MIHTAQPIAELPVRRDDTTDPVWSWPAHVVDLAIRRGMPDVSAAFCPGCCTCLAQRILALYVSQPRWHEGNRRYYNFARTFRVTLAGAREFAGDRLAAALLDHLVPVAETEEAPELDRDVAESCRLSAAPA